MEAHALDESATITKGLNKMTSLKEEDNKLLYKMAKAIWTAIKKHELGDKCFERAYPIGDFKEHWAWYQKNKVKCIEARYSTLAAAEKAAQAAIDVIIDNIEKENFIQGYACCAAFICHDHEEYSLASDAMNHGGFTWEDLINAKVDDYDLMRLKEVQKAINITKEEGND